MLVKIKYIRSVHPFCDVDPVNHILDSKVLRGARLEMDNVR